VSQPAEGTAEWRAPVCILLLFLVAVFVIEGRDLVIFTRAFTEVRSSWLPVQALVVETSIATSERRSASTRSGVVGHITLFIAGAKVRYTLNDKTYDVDALGWEERLRSFSRWETAGVRPGRSVSVRVDPEAPDHATLLGDWTPASLVVFGGFIATELALLCGILIGGKFAIRRTAKPQEPKKAAGEEGPAAIVPLSSSSNRQRFERRAVLDDQGRTVKLDKVFLPELTE
jgi:hypothetical protein